MNQELITAVEAIRTAILQSPNSSDASDELTAIIPIMDFKLSEINLSDFPWKLQLTNLFLKCRKICRKFCQIWMILRRLCKENE
ncbi:MAG: hypothetical protein ACI4LS_01105 [Treponema sp.]